MSHRSTRIAKMFVSLINQYDRDGYQIEFISAMEGVDIENGKHSARIYMTDYGIMEEWDGRRKRFIEIK